MVEMEMEKIIKKKKETRCPCKIIKSSISVEMYKMNKLNKMSSPFKARKNIMRTAVNMLSSCSKFLEAMERRIRM